MSMKNILYLLLFIPFTFLGQTFLSIEQDIPLELSEGWNMFGYSCYEPMDAIEAFSPVVDKVIIVKDNSGAVYMTEFGFNGIGNLQYNQGYQIKTTQAITDFQFCPDIIPVVEGCMDATAFNYNGAAHSDDGSCFPFVYGCMNDPSAYNFNDIDGDGQANYFTGLNGIDINTDDGSCFAVILGCLNIEAYNYNDYDYDGQANALTGINGIDVNTDDGSCVLSEACPYDIYVEYSADAQSYNVDLCQTLIVLGCMDEIALNFNLLANTNDGSCQYFGCMDSTAFNYNEIATIDDGGCIYYGCIDSIADNYDSTANTDDGTCIYLGCIDEVADNYDSQANTDDSTCIYLGCMDETADNYNPQANQEDGTCIYYGCMNPTADNYDPQANEDDGSCIIYGCTLAAFPNYNSEATIDDFSCDMSSADVFGCTDPSYLEYDLSVNQDNGTCSVLVVYGCTGPDHCNYNPEANTDDGSCVYAQEGYDCYGNLVPIEIGAIAYGGIIFYIDETGEHGLVAAMEDLGQIEWGCNGTDINGDNSSVSPEQWGIGTGLQNTLEIVSGCSETPIAASEALAYESEGYSDWYLPSFDELYEMYSTIGQGGPEGNIGGFSNSYYWSSSEANNSYAYIVMFNNGGVSNVYKYYTHRVRVIRSF